MMKSNKLTARSRFVFTLVLGVFAMIGVVILAFGIGQYRKAKASVDWPTVEGTVLASDVSRSRSSSDGSTTWVYSAKVLFEYMVDGYLHTSNLVSLGDYSSNNPSHANSVVQRYPVGAKVDVYYDPDDPRVGILEPGVGFGNLILLIVGGGFALFGIVGFVLLRLAPIEDADRHVGLSAGSDGHLSPQEPDDAPPGPRLQ